VLGQFAQTSAREETRIKTRFRGRVACLQRAIVETASLQKLTGKSAHFTATFLSQVQGTKFSDLLDETLPCHLITFASLRLEIFLPAIHRKLEMHSFGRETFNTVIWVGGVKRS